MSGYADQVAAVVAATQVHSPTAYSWLGQVESPPPRAIGKGVSRNTARRCTRDHLQWHLYRHFYCQGMVVPTNHLVQAESTLMAASAPFVQRLSLANSGHGCCGHGWRVRAVEDGQVVAERDGLSLWLRPEDVAAVGDDGPAVPDVTVAVRFPKESLRLSPGFYMALGDEELLPQRQGPLLRLYWNLLSEAAPDLVARATSWLNRARIPFHLKVINDPARYTRCDAGVLYVARHHFPDIAGMLGALCRELSGGMLPATPAFTKPLAPGLGLAEDPGDGDSFGMHRCRLLADGLLRAHEVRKRAAGERLEVVRARFAEEGISLEHPYLNPASRDEYAVPVARPRRRPVPR